MPSSFAIAVVLHGLVSTLVGLLYGAMLPMFPRRPILLGGLIAPVLWSGLLYSILGLLNPLLAEPHRLAVVHGVAGRLSASSRASSWCGSRACRRARTCRSRCALGLKLPDSCRHEEAERSARERLAMSRRFRDVWRITLLSGCAARARPATQGLGDAGAERGRGIRHAVRRELRRLPRRGGTRRSGHRARRPGLSSHRGRDRDARASSPTAYAEPRCRLSPRAPAEC